MTSSCTWAVCYMYFQTGNNPVVAVFGWNGVISVVQSGRYVPYSTPPHAMNHQVWSHGSGNHPVFDSNEINPKNGGVHGGTNVVAISQKLIYAAPKMRPVRFQECLHYT